MGVARMVLVLLLLALVAAQTASAAPEYQFFWDLRPTLVAEFTSVKFNFTGSTWGSEAAAVAAGAFIVKNNIITGINRYRDTTFLCVPRWFPGVPSTLNTLTWDATGKPMLNPWPNWDWQTQLHYVQAVFVDHHNGEIWVIDAGRENIFDSAAVINRNAALHIFNIATQQRVHYVQFPDSILPITSSFLNDIVVDTQQMTAYMSDTNTIGNGAIVSYSRNTGSMFRFQSYPSTFADTTYTVNVNGVQYPKVQNPVDGIALSGDAQTLYYSAVDGTKMYGIPTQWLTPGLSSANASATFVQTVYDKNSASDGLMWLPTSPVGQVAYGLFTTPAVSAVNLKTSMTAPSSAAGRTILWADSANCQWVDTFAVQPVFNVSDSPVIPGMTFGYYNSVQGFSLWFTTNKLQTFFNGSMDFSDGAPANMRIYQLNYYSDQTQDLARAKVLLIVGIVLLILVAALYFGFFRRFAAPMKGPSDYRKV